MLRSVFVICATLAIVWTTGCAPSPVKPPPTVKVKGTVQLDGKDMEAGEVWFVIEGFPPKQIDVKGGKFEGDAHEGKNKVEVHAYKDGPMSTTDPKVPTKIDIVSEEFRGLKTKLEATVKAGDANDFNFKANTSK